MFVKELTSLYIFKFAFKGSFTLKTGLDSNVNMNIIINISQCLASGGFWCFWEKWRGETMGNSPWFRDNTFGERTRNSKRALPKIPKYEMWALKCWGPFHDILSFPVVSRRNFEITPSIAPRQTATWAGPGEFGFAGCRRSLFPRQ